MCVFYMHIYMKVILKIGVNVYFFNVLFKGLIGNIKFMKCAY